MVVNFRTRGISRDVHKLTRTYTLIKKKVQLEILDLIYIKIKIDFFTPIEIEE
jgi:hypothetical protein